MFISSKLKKIVFLVHILDDTCNLHETFLCCANTWNVGVHSYIRYQRGSRGSTLVLRHVRAALEEGDEGVLPRTSTS